jgi:hypothetical protein
MPRINQWETHKCQRCGDETQNYYPTSIYDKEYRPLVHSYLCKDCALEIKAEVTVVPAGRVNFTEGDEVPCSSQQDSSSGFVSVLR